MGSTLPKQYLTLAGKTLLEHSLQALLGCPKIDTVAVALAPDDHMAAELAALDDPRVIRVAGGAERCDSVLCGLDSLAAGVAAPDDWVLVHDAARPCLRPQDVARLIDSVTASGVGGLLAEPIADTVKQADDDGLVCATLDRSRLWRAQTPQMFRLQELRAALVAARAGDLAVTDEASAMELAGHPVQLVRGPSRNLKVTVPGDLPLAGWYPEQATVEGEEQACE
jgi:2-C-methyl-D-erythritol 4-phosphate cytidylyltransferase